MPGYANWRNLYRDEVRQLREEGFLIDETLAETGGEFLPFPDAERPGQEESDRTEAEWEQVYHRLWGLRERGVRPDWPYIEPDTYEEIIAAAADVPALTCIAADAYEERIKGAWYGRCAGVVLGKPLEMGWDHTMIRKYLESVDAYPLTDWVPERSESLGIVLREDCRPSTRGNVRYTQPDDDIHYTILSLLLVEQKGLHFTRDDVGRNLLENVPIYWLWGADHQLYWHLVRLENDPALEAQWESLPYQVNPWREWIDGQLKADLWGYLTPANPREGAKYIHRQASVSLVKNGVYGGMFVSGCLSAALSDNPTVETILQGGLSVIPQRSRLAEAIQNVMRWYEQAPDWWTVCDQIYTRYGHLHFADQINNLALVVLALLEGQLDYTRSITTAVMAGTDVDCNSATVGSIVGAAVGYRNLERRWIDPLNDTVQTVVAGFGQGRISDLVERIIAQRQKHFTC